MELLDDPVPLRHGHVVDSRLLYAKARGFDQGEIALVELVQEYQGGTRKFGLGPG